MREKRKERQRVLKEQGLVISEECVVKCFIEELPQKENEGK